MKTNLLPSLALAFISSPLWASLDATAAPDEATIVERGPHHRIWERQSVRLLPNGHSITNRSSVVELETGMNVLKDGQWTESREDIELFQDGAIARQGPHQVIWAPNINTAGAIDLLTPDGQRLRSHVLGLGIFDSTTGQSELIAEIKDSIGQLNPPNEIFYLDAFDGLLADVRYTYRKGGFAQDVILREKVDLPKGYNPATTRLEVWTEFMESPEPRRHEQVLAGMTDESLSFGVMEIGSGKAFAAGRVEKSSAPVAKRWMQINGRTFLVEAVPVVAIAAELDRLPAPKQQAALHAPKAARGAGERPFPARRQAKAGKADKKIQMASLLPPNKGLVLDYDLVTSSSYRFECGKTYYVSGTVTISGTATFEGGAVIKYANTNTAKIKLTGTVDWKADAYRPVILTARDDHTVGEQIGSSSRSGY